MMGATSIPYATKGWSPVVGCPLPLVSDGCQHCWARELHNRRHRAYRHGKHLPKMYDYPFELVQTFPERLDEPLHWRKPQTVAVCFQGDLFHEAVPDEFIANVFWIMAKAQHHTFKILTKRPERLNKNMNPVLPNVWLGVSVEDQATADARIPLLLQTAAAVHWVSYEPSLGPLHIYPQWWPHNCRQQECEEYVESGVDWLVCGGESGPQARPCDVAWIRSVVAQCKAAAVPCFVKQLGAKPNGLFVSSTQWAVTKRALKDRSGADPSEWPEDLRVREFPC